VARHIDRTKETAEGLQAAEEAEVALLLAADVAMEVSADVAAVAMVMAWM
jgi:hypothetical protein